MNPRYVSQHTGAVSCIILVGRFCTVKFMGLQTDVGSLHILHVGRLRIALPNYGVTADRKFLASAHLC